MTEYNFSENCGSKVITPSKGENLVIKYKREHFPHFSCSWSKNNLNFIINITITDKDPNEESDAKVLATDVITIKNLANISVSNFEVVSWSETEDEHGDPIIKSNTIVSSDDIFTIKLNAPKNAKTTKAYMGNCVNQEIIATSKNDTIKAGGGTKNILFGGEGNDKLYAGKGSTIFLFGNGNNPLPDKDSMSTIEYYYQYERESTYNDGNDTIYNAKSKDKIVFSNTSSLDSLEFIRQGNDLKILNTTDSSSVKIAEFFTSSDKIDKLYFDSTALDRVFKEEDDYYSLKDSGINVLYLGSGKLKGSEYNEVIVGSNKKDTIYTGNGVDSVYGRKGNDTININGDGQKLVYFEGIDPLNPSSVIYEGNDTINISKNAEGKYIDTTLVFSSETTPETEKPSDTVPVSYTSSLNGKDLIVTHYFHPTAGNVLYIKDGTIKVKNYFTNYSEEYLTSNEDLKICIGDINGGSVSNVSDILSNVGVTINGNSKKKNTITGTRFDDTITAGNKADKIYSGSGDDIINAKKGSDKIYLTGEGNKTVLLYKGAGKDTLYINAENAKADLKYSDNAEFSYTSNGSNVVINAKYDKKTTDKTTIVDAFKHENDITIGAKTLAQILDAEKIKITASYNKKKKTNTFTGTKYDDVISGTSKKDIINADEGNNTINIGKKSSSTITAGSGDDTYNVKNLSVSVKIADEGGSDTLNLSGVKITDINLLFDVTKSDGKTGDDLYLVNNKNMGLISSNKATMPKAGIDLVGYFAEGKIESVNLGETLISGKFVAMINEIKGEVKTFLEGTSYDSAFDLLNDKSKGAKSLKKQLVSIYTKYKADQDYGIGAQKPMSVNSLALVSEVAAWQSTGNSYDGAVNFENNTNNTDVQALIAEYNPVA